jgi:hypothetical protein
VPDTQPQSRQLRVPPRMLDQLFQLYRMYGSLEETTGYTVVNLAEARILLTLREQAAATMRREDAEHQEVAESFTR